VKGLLPSEKTPLRFKVLQHGSHLQHARISFRRPATTDFVTPQRMALTILRANIFEGLCPYTKSKDRRKSQLGNMTESRQYHRCGVGNSSKYARGIAL
jgi:hypothetical protein